MQRSLRSASLLCGLGLAALLCACGGSSRAPGSPAPPAYRGQTPVLLTAGAVAMLPADTWFVLAGASPRVLAAELRWPEVLRGHAKLHELLSAGARAITGADVVDPDNLDEIGLDPAGAVGLALFAGDREAAGVLFARVSDRARLQAFLDRALAPALGGLEPRAVGQATALYPAREEELALVLRGDFVFVLVVEDEQDRARLVDALATSAPEKSLAADPAMLAAMKRLDFGAEIAGYLAMHHVGDRMLRELDRGAERTRGYLQEFARTTEAEIASAESGGASAEEVAELRARLAEQEQWMEQAERSTAATRRLVGEIVQPLGGIGLGAGIDGPDLRVRVALEPRAGSLPARLLRHGGRPLGILRALDQAPVFALGGHGEPGALVELVERSAEISGTGMDELGAAVRALAGVDLEQEVIPLFDGEIAVAVTGDRERLFAGGSSRGDAIGVSAVAGLRDPARAQALLDRLSALPALAAVGANRPAGRGLVVPGWDGKQIYIDVAGEHLIVSTDREAAARMTAGAGSLADRLTGEAQALLRAQPWDGLLFLDVGAMLGMTWSGTADPPPPVANQPDGAQSEKNAALQRELAAIEAELTSLQAEVETAMRQRALATTRPLGAMLLVAHAGDRGMAIFGGQLTSAPPLSDAVLGWIVGWLELSGAGDIATDPALARKKERLRQLEARHWEITMELVGPPPPPAPNE
ncbi:MAG TPA: hypothetical protein VNM90_30355 [Haliangium sp.]|nr:hypothetical protein [Haliangium sp.]